MTFAWCVSWKSNKYGDSAIDFYRVATKEKRKDNNLCESAIVKWYLQLAILRFSRRNILMGPCRLICKGFDSCENHACKKLEKGTIENGESYKKMHWRKESRNLIWKQVII